MNNQPLPRRTFFQLCSALAAWMASPAQNVNAAPQAARRAVQNRKNFVAIQMKPHAWIDEGIEQCLDNLQKGAVNTIWAYTYDWEMGPRNTPNGTIPLPDHGKYGDPTFHGGAFYNYDPKFFHGTMLSQFRSSDYGNWDVIAEVAPKAKARGMDFFCWDYNNESRRMMQNMPNAAKVAEVDLYGRRMIGPCFNHPDYRAHQIGKIESYLRGYPNEVAGIAWGCERQGPFRTSWAAVGRVRASVVSASTAGRSKRARHFGRSRQGGYHQFAQLIRAAANDQRPVDGYFVTFWRMLLDTRRFSRGRNSGPTATRRCAPNSMASRRRSRRKAIRLSHHAEHDVQPVLPGRRGLLEDQGLHRTISSSQHTTTPAGLA